MNEKEREKNENCSDERYDFETHTLGRIMFLLPVDGGILSLSLSRWRALLLFSNHVNPGVTAKYLLKRFSD